MKSKSFFQSSLKISAWFRPALAISIIAGWLFAGTAFAVTPTLSVTSNGDGDTVQVNVTGDANSSVLMYYTKTNYGQQLYSLGTTNSSGSLITSVSSSGIAIVSGTSVYVTVGGLNGAQSPAVSWPNVSTTGNFSLSQTGAVLTVGQSTTITANNLGSSYLYVSNNSNPPVANVNISGSQITITGISNGSTTVSLCTPTTTNGNNSTACASVYVTVSSNGGQTLTFSMNNVTVAQGQSIPITISGGNGNYQVSNNSNSSVIQTNLSGSTITLSTNSTSGNAAITVCTSDMSACGIINATAGTSSTLPLSFSQTNPTVPLGQSLNVSVSGGNSTSYYVSNNSSPTVVSVNLSGSNLALTGNNAGTSTLTICSSSGSCGTLTVTVNYVANGGTFQLSQNTLSLLVGQVLSVTASGGTAPYSLTNGSTSYYQASLSGNIVSVSGLSAGSGNLTVCSNGGACGQLYVVVNASGNGSTLTFSQNSLSLTPGAVTAVTMTGSGGYYVTSSSNSAAASVQISGNTAVVSALAAGSTNISICQSGGQCAILAVTVTAGTSTTNIPQFSQTNPNLSGGQTITETVSGGSSANYYVQSNTNPSVVNLSLNGNQLTVTGLSSGSSIIVICSASNSCGVLTANVTGSSSAAVSFLTTSLQAGTVNQPYNLQLSASGGSGGYQYNVGSGILPPGLTLSTTGLISGTPTVAGTSSFSLKVTDSSSNAATANFSLTVNTGTALSMPTSTATTTTAVPGTFTSGQLISENGTIYIVFQNTKVGFANAPAFLGLGYKFTDVTAVTNSSLTLSPKVVITADGAHPRGAWISNGKTVYFVTPDGLIPVPTWDILLSNGGQASFIVKANSYDLSRKKLPLMTAGDSRMH